VGLQRAAVRPGTPAAGAITLMAPLLRAQGQEQALIRMVVVAAARISRQLILR
jgi:hypothetical protein